MTGNGALVVGALVTAVGGLAMAWRPEAWQAGMVRVFGGTASGSFFRSSTYTLVLRTSGVLLCASSIGFALSVPASSMQGERRVGPGRRAVTVFSEVEVASSDQRGLVVCVLEPGLDEAWEAVRLVGRHPDSERLRFVVVSSVRRFLLPVREPWLTVRTFIQSPPGAWRIGSDELRARVIPVAVRVCVNGESPGSPTGSPTESDGAK